MANQFLLEVNQIRICALVSLTFYITGSVTHVFSCCGLAAGDRTVRSRSNSITLKPHTTSCESRVRSHVSHISREMNVVSV